MSSLHHPTDPSQLGPLAALGSVQTLPSSLSTAAELDLDSALGELLGEEEEQWGEGGGGEERVKTQLPVSPRSKLPQTQKGRSRYFSIHCIN